MNDNTVELRTPLRDGQWSPDERAIFTYSLPFDENSDICGRLHHRTGETVTVIELNDRDQNEPWLREMPTISGRADEGALVSYAVRFPDGHEDTAFEDELSEVTS
jgi:hypothetical protein